MSTYSNPWLLHGKPLESEDVTNYVGMVYLIVNEKNNKKYIGKKFFWSKRKLPPLKGQKRKRTKIVETDWKDYYGSSNALKEDLEKYGSVHFKRYVLELCYTKTQCAYYELKHQVDNEAILSEEYYNDFIGGKINGRHLEKL
jgi:hypothetical protein